MSGMELNEKTPAIEFDGRKLAALRETRSVTQARLARAVGIRPQSLCGIEKNRHSPSARTLVKLCEILGAEPKDFFKT